VARRLLGGTAVRRARLVRGIAIATFSTAVISLLFAAAAIANEVALRDRPAGASRFGPTDGSVDPPLCDRRIDAGRNARLVATYEGDVDRRSIGSASLVGLRDRRDVRWAADVATDRTLGRYGMARVGDAAWTLEPREAWREVPVEAVEREDVDLQVLATALRSTNLVTAEELGLEFVEGARARHCRVAVDGTTFAAAFPQVRWLAGQADLHRWRGDIDYWVFTDGELGRAEGSIGGEAGALGLDGLQGTLRATLIAVDRDRPVSVVRPSR